jgi:hypothetical protein
MQDSGNLLLLLVIQDTAYIEAFPLFRIQNTYARYALCLYLCSSSELVEDMVVPLIRWLERNSWLFEQVVLNNTAPNLPTRVKADLHELPESTRIIVPHRLGIP